MKWLDSPTKGTFKIVVKESDRSHAPSIEQKKLKSDFFMATYPDGYRVKVLEASESGTLEKTILLGMDASSKKVLISFDKTRETDLSNVSAVQYRQLHPELYKENKIILDNRNGLLYEKQDGSYEKTSFFLQNDILTTISLTAPLTHRDFDKDYAYILDSFFWK